MKGASTRRRIQRLQLSVNRKSTATRWMNAWTVGVCVSKMKAGKGAEKSCRSRRSRRGQRLGKVRARGGKPRSTTPTGPPRQSGYERRINHQGRKYLWAVQAANRLASTRAGSRLITNFSREGPEWLRREEGQVTYQWFCRSWHGIARHAREVGVHPMCCVESTPKKFVAVRGCWRGDVDEFLEHVRIQLGDWVHARHATLGYAMCRLCGLRAHWGVSCSRNMMIEAQRFGLIDPPPPRTRTRRRRRPPS